MVIQNQALRGQVFLKYLWQHDAYKTSGGVSPTLANDIRAIALKREDIESSKALTNKDVFNWINGSVIPKWVKISSFELCLRHGWQPVDHLDVLTVLRLDIDLYRERSLSDLVEIYSVSYKITFPKPLLEKIFRNGK